MAELDNFTDLLIKLDRAKNALIEAERVESAARTDSCNARNRLNECQKRFDAVVESIKKEAPRDSDWGYQRLRPRNVA